MQISEISEKLGNVTKSYLLEPLNLEAIHAKIKAACKRFEVEFIPEAVKIDGIYIRRTELEVEINFKNLTNHFNINYDIRPKEFRTVLSCYGGDSARFRLDAVKWVDTDDLLCLPMFYTYGQPIITNLSRKEFLSASCSISKHFAEKGGFDVDNISSLNYNDYEQKLKAETYKRDFASELIELYSK